MRKHEFFVRAQTFDPISCNECGVTLADGAPVFLSLWADANKIDVFKVICMKCMGQRPTGQQIDRTQTGPPVVGRKD